MGNGGEIYVIDMGKSIKIIDMAHKMIQLAGLKVNTDIEVKFTGLRPGEKMFEETLNKNETTSKTHNPKILIGKVSNSNLNETIKIIDEIEQSIEAQENDKIVRSMKKIIPEFISNNSEFSKLDN
jgi:FlaA1/EpsC-like NDP-sugar epimerase